MRVTNCSNIFVDQGQLSDPDFISGTHQRENVQFVDKSFRQMRKREVMGFHLDEHIAMDWCS